VYFLLCISQNASTAAADRLPGGGEPHFPRPLARRTSLGAGGHIPRIPFTAKVGGCLQAEDRNRTELTTIDRLGRWHQADRLKDPWIFGANRTPPLKPRTSSKKDGPSSSFPIGDGVAVVPVREYRRRSAPGQIKPDSQAGSPDI